jgi:hypothetical protein
MVSFMTGPLFTEGGPVHTEGRMSAETCPAIFPLFSVLFFLVVLFVA